MRSTLKALALGLFTTTVAVTAAGGARAQNMINNGDFESGNAGFTSDYPYYSGSGTIPIGSYTIGANANDFNTQYFSSLVDHTSGSGTYFIADASGDITLAPWVSERTIDITSTSSTYRFTAYLANINDDGTAPALPRLAFEIGDGSTWVEIATTDVISIGANGSNTGWVKFEQTMQFTGTGLFYLRLKNATTGVIGNDFGLDDVSFELCSSCTASQTVNLGTLDPAPTLLSSSPSDGEVDATIDADITLTFNEAVVLETGTIVIKKVSDNTIVESFDVATSTALSGSGTTTITINPTSDFDYSTDYYIEIADTAIDDASSNSYAGITGATTLNFTTVAEPVPTPPTNYLAAESCVTVNLLSPGQTFLAFLCNFPSISVPQSMLVVDPASNTAMATFGQRYLCADASDTTCALIQDGDPISEGRHYLRINLSKKPFDAYVNAVWTNNDGWSDFRDTFTNPTTVLSDGPSLSTAGTGIDPAADERYTTLTVRFSEPVSGFTIEDFSSIEQERLSNFTQIDDRNYSVVVDKLSDISTTFSVVIDRRTYSALASGTQGIGGLVANLSSYQIPRPVLVSSTPSDNDTDVGLSSNIELTFDKAVDFDTGTIVIKRVSDDSIVESFDVTTSTAISGSGTTTITINPIADFNPSTDYYIEISGTALRDASGDGYAVISGATTLNFKTVATDSDADITASGTVSEPVGLDTTIDSAGEAIDLFDFTISDGGTSDGFATIVNQIVVNVSGTTTDSVRNKITWRLDGPDASNVAGIYNPSDDTITFSNLSVAIADGDSETYTINGYFNENTGLIEDQTFILSINGATDLSLDPSGTQMGTTSAVTNGTGGTIDVVASVLAFTTQPAGSTSGSALSIQPVVSAQDAFGNTDTDFTETVTLTEASAGTLTNSSVAAVSGVATFTGVVYTATADQQTFTIAANDQDGVGTDLSSITANSVTSDVMATALQFSTQPGPLAVEDRLATSFTTVPVVRAVDGNGIVDTGYSTGITLSEINGAGAATMTGVGDTDSDGATVTILPASGVATFTGLTITYTQLGGSDETFNLQATSGSLAVANSSQLRSSDTITPSGYSAAFDQMGINSSNETTASFTFAGAEVGARYTYTISSSGGGTIVTGTTGTVSTPTDQITNIDVSGLGDGILTLSVKLTDAAGNEGQEATDTVTKDATAPSGYSVSFDQDSVNDGNQTAIGFTFANAEIGANYFYVIVSSGGGTEVTGTGTITSASQSILGLDLSGLTDGTLVLSVRLVDPAGNIGAAAQDTVTKDVLAPIAPASLSLAESSNSGSTADTLTNDTTATINGTAEANSTVTVYVDETEVGTATADGSGNWNFTFAEGDLTTGENSITAKAMDTAGNVSPTSSALLIIIDTGAPTLRITGSTEVVTEAFTVTFTFSENVTGFGLDDINIEGGSLNEFSGSGDTYAVVITPVLGQTITVSVAANVAQDDAGNGNEASNTYTIQAGSPASEFEANRRAIEDVLYGEMTRSVQSNLSISTRMVREARGRLIDAQGCGGFGGDTSVTGGSSDASGEACDAGTISNKVDPVTIDGIASATPTTVSTSGIIHGQTSYNYGQTRRLVFGDFDVQRDRNTGSTTATLSGRVAWEQVLESNTLLGYFVGLEYADSQIDGTFKGDQTRIGLSFGGYAVQRMAEHLYADGYLSMGLGNNDLQMSNGTLALQSDYSSQTVTAGAALSGLYAYEQFEFRPELAINYGRTELGNVGFTGTAYGLTDDTLSLYAGSLTVTSLTLRPELLVALDGESIAQSLTVMSFAPRLICEQTNSTLRTDTDECGGGAEVGFEASSEDGLSSINFRIAVDEIGNTRRSTGQLGAELRF